MNETGFRKNLKWIADVWRVHPILLITMILLGIFSGAVAAAEPYILKWIVDSIASSADSPADSFRHTRLIFISMLLGLGVLQFFSNFYPGMRGYINHLLEAEIRTRIFKELLEKSYDFFLRFRSGDILTRLTDDLAGFPKTSWFLCSGIFRAFNALCVILASFAVMATIHLRLTLLSMVTLPLMAGIFLAFNARVREAFKKKQAMVSSTNEHMESCILGIDILKAYNATSREAGRFREVMDERTAKEIEVVKVEGFFSSFFPNLSFLGQLVVVGAGGWLVMQKRISVGDFYAFFSYLSFLIFYAIDIAMFLVSGRQALVSIGRLRELEEDTAFLPSGKCLPLPEGKIHTISVNHLDVELNAGSGKKQLSGIDFTMPSGSWLAIVGPVGSGKSTLLRAIAGMLLPIAGSVEINGEKIGDIDREVFAPQLGFVESEPVVFSTTVGENISFFRDLDSERIRWASSIAQLSPDIEEMPAGFLQEIGEKGVMLSGGQRQRLAIARALANRPGLLLLDDVTSSLDADNEARFLDSINRELSGITCILATHRLKSARRADLIICLKDGNVVGSGNHDHLMKNCPTYKDLVEAHEIG